mgnify:CR=1 FL=1
MITLREVVNGIVVKRSILADNLDKQLETESGFSPRLAFIEYKDAYNKTDTLASYTFRVQDLAKFTDDPYKLNSMLRDNRFIYKYLDKLEQEELLSIKRKDVLENYVEYNEYYRMLMGLPRMKVQGGTLVEDDAWFVYLPTNVKLQGVDNKIPIHKMTDLQKRSVSASGELAKLIVQYPRHEYLKYVDKKISSLVMREAKEYEIIYSDSTKKNIRSFVDHYRAVRNNFMVNYYDEMSAIKYSFYESLQCVNLLMAAMANVNAYMPRDQLDSEIIDESFIYTLFESYGVPKFNFSLEYLQKIAQRLGGIMRKKGTKNVLLEISKTFNEISIFKYFLWKRLAPNNEDLSKSDKEKYELFFVKAPIMADDPYEYVKDIENLIPYKEVVDQDPKWGVDGDDLEDTIKSLPFTYTESKYITLNNKVDLVSFSFEMSFFIRYVVEHTKSFKDIKFYIDTATYEASLFEVITYLQCLVYRKMKINPDIPDCMQPLIYLYGIKYDIDLEKLKDTIRDHFKYTKLENSLSLNNFIQMLDGKRYNIGEVINAYEANMELIYHLREVQRNVNDVRDYNKIGQILKAITYSEKLPELYNNNTNLEDFLGTYTSESVRLIQRMDEIKGTATPGDEKMYNHEISEVINILRSYINVNKHKRMAEMLDTAQTLYSDYDLLDYLEKIIDFFKAYTQDILSKGMEYSIHDIRDGCKTIEKLLYVMELDSWEQNTFLNLYTDRDTEILKQISDERTIKDVCRTKEVLRCINNLTGDTEVISRFG